MLAILDTVAAPCSKCPASSIAAQCRAHWSTIEKSFLPGLAADDTSTLLGAAMAAAARAMTIGATGLGGERKSEVAASSRWRSMSGAARSFLRSDASQAARPKSSMPTLPYVLTAVTASPFRLREDAAISVAVGGAGKLLIEPSTAAADWIASAVIEGTTTCGGIIPFS